MSKYQKYFCVVFCWVITGIIMNSMGIGWMDYVPIIFISNLAFLFDDVLRHVDKKECKDVSNDFDDLNDDYCSGYNLPGYVADEHSKAVRPDG